MHTFNYINQLYILFDTHHTYIKFIFIDKYISIEHFLMLHQEAAISCWSNHQLQRMIRDVQSTIPFLFQN
jgi:hypothetical protein